MIRRTMRLETIFLLFFLPALLSADLIWKDTEGEFSVEVKLNKTKISVEEELEIEVIFVFPETHRPDLDTIRMNLLRHISLGEPPFSLEEETVAQTDQGLKVLFKLEPQKAGLQFLSLYQIPFLPKNPGARPVEILSDIFQIEITLPKIKEGFQGDPFSLLSLTEPYSLTLSPSNRKNLLQDRNEIISLLEQRKLPWPQIAGATLLCILILVIRMQPAKHLDLFKEQLKIAQSAKKKALKALLSLSHASSEDYTRYYIALTNTVRRYIEDRFQLKAPTQTTQEFLHEIAGHPEFDQETQAALLDFLYVADRVKFAVQIPTQEDCEKAHLTARQFIENH